MKMRIGVIGLTHPHVRGHLAALQLMEDVEAIYVVEEDEAALAQVKNRPKYAGAFTNLDDLLRLDDVPVLMLMKRSYEAVPPTLKAIEAGKHVMGDKPFVRTAGEMAHILDAAAKKNVLIGTFYCYRWKPENQMLLNLRKQGAFGRLMSAEMRMVTTLVSLRNPGNWLFKKELSGGGILHWMGCHEIDWLRYITGEEITEVSAMINTVGGEDIDVEDVATVSMRLSSGALATLHCAYALVGGRSGYHHDRYNTYYGVRGTLGRAWSTRAPEPGEGATLTLESLAPGWDHVNRHTFNYVLPSSEAYAGVFGMDFLRAFYRAALERREPPIHGEDSLKVLQVIDAAYRSAETGRVVAL